MLDKYHYSASPLDGHSEVGSSPSETHTVLAATWLDSAAQEWSELTALLHEPALPHAWPPQHEGHLQHASAAPSYSGIPSSSTARRSKPKRLRWTPELHTHFLAACNSVGGPEKATPKQILAQMGVEGLGLLHVKSHLQKYRLSMKEAAKAQRGECAGDCRRAFQGSETPVAAESESTSGEEEQGEWEEGLAALGSSMRLSQLSAGCDATDAGQPGIAPNFCGTQMPLPQPQQQQQGHGHEQQGISGCELSTEQGLESEDALGSLHSGGAAGGQSHSEGVLGERHEEGSDNAAEGGARTDAAAAAVQVPAPGEVAPAPSADEAERQSLVQRALAVQMDLQRQLQEGLEAQRAMQSRLLDHGQFIQRLIREKSPGPDAACAPTSLSPVATAMTGGGAAPEQGPQQAAANQLAGDNKRVHSTQGGRAAKRGKAGPQPPAPAAAPGAASRLRRGSSNSPAPTLALAPSARSSLGRSTTQVMQLPKPFPCSPLAPPGQAQQQLMDSTVGAPGGLLGPQPWPAPTGGLPIPSPHQQAGALTAQPQERLPHHASQGPAAAGGEFLLDPSVVLARLAHGLPVHSLELAALQGPASPLTPAQKAHLLVMASRAQQAQQASHLSAASSAAEGSQGASSSLLTSLSVQVVLPEGQAFPACDMPQPLQEQRLQQQRGSLLVAGGSGSTHTTWHATHSPFAASTFPPPAELGLGSDPCWEGAAAPGWMAAQGHGGSAGTTLSMLGAQSSVCFPLARPLGQERSEGEGQDLDAVGELLDDPGLLDELLYGDLM